MDPGPVSDAGRDAVFVSYSHQDAAWVQRVAVLLKPLLRRKRVRLLWDADIRVGEEWRPEIESSIRQSAVALLLVTPDFLASDFIMEQELPSLLREGVRLAPVLIRDCLWRDVEELTRVQWLHDPGRDGALGLVEDRPGERDQRLCEVCERLMALLPAAPEGEHSGLPEHPAAQPATVAAAPRGSAWGELFGVPSLPPGYVARDELARLIDAVVGVEGGAVGLTGEVPALGLHGQGGIGKSVLAAAAARPEEIRRRFPDGVYWVTVGERTDVLTAQIDLLGRLGAPDRSPRTPGEAVSHLAEVLRDRRVLLVVDDVWSDAAALAFRATGPLGRVLFTSRDPQVLAGAGARTHPVGVLSPSAAKELAARILGPANGELIPDSAVQVFAQVGRVALAVALLAAAVRGGRSWDQVAEHIARDVDRFGDHPYANTFKAIQVAIAALPDDLSGALLSLAVVPPDADVPVAAIVRYWAKTRGRTPNGTADDLAALSAAGLVQTQHLAGVDVVGFHDLQHDYLLLHAPELSLLHTDLLDAYRVLLPADGQDQWWQLPPAEPYIWGALVEHLCGAGERRAVVSTVTDPAYLVRRIEASGSHAAESDLARASVALPGNDRIAWWQAWIGRHTHLLRAVVRPDPMPWSDAMESRDSSGLIEYEVVPDPDRLSVSPRFTVVAGRPAEPSGGGSGDGVAPTVLAWLAVDPTRPDDIGLGRLAPLMTGVHLEVRWGLSPPSTAQRRVLIGHAGRVLALAWSPDGAVLATGCADQLVRLWDPVTGRVLRELVGHSRGVSAVAWSPDSAWLASAGGDGEVRLWDPSTGATVHLLPGHRGEVSALAWAPHSRLATGGYDRSVRIWDPTGPELIGTLDGHRRWVHALAWSADGTRLASASSDGRSRVWDASTLQPLADITCHTFGLHGVAWSPVGDVLATGGDGQDIQLWDPTTGSPTSQGAGDVGVRALQWDPRGPLVAACREDEVRLWDPSTARTVHTFPGHTGVVRALAWSPDGSCLASGGDDGLVRVWDTAVDPTLHPDGAAREVIAIGWSTDGTRVATAAADGTVRTCDADTGRAVSSIVVHAGEIHAAAWSTDGSRLAVAGADGQVRITDGESGRPLHLLTAHGGEIQSVEWSPGARLVTLGEDGQIRFWDGGTGQLIRTLSSVVISPPRGSRLDRGSAAAWTPDGTRLATTGRYHRRVRVWDVVEGDLLCTLTGLTTVNTVAWSPDGTRLFTGGDRGQARVWDPATGRSRDLAVGRSRSVDAMAWSVHGTRVALACDDGLLIVLDPDRPEVCTHLQVGPVTCLSWTSSGIAFGGSGFAGVVDLLGAPPRGW